MFYHIVKKSCAIGLVLVFQGGFFETWASENLSENLNEKIDTQYSHSSTHNVKEADAIKYLTEAAKKGDAGAQYELGRVCYHSQNLLLPYMGAVHWWRLAAEQGHADAQHKLGCFYYFHDSTNARFKKKAIRLWIKAAEQGHVDAQF